MYRLVAIDLDGTMLNQYGIITAETKDVIKRVDDAISLFGDENFNEAEETSGGWEEI